MRTPEGRAAPRPDRGQLVAAALDRAASRPEVARHLEAAANALVAGELDPAAAHVRALVDVVRAEDRAVAGMDGRYVLRAVIADVARRAAGGAAPGGALYARLGREVEGRIAPPNALSPPRR